MKVLHISTSDQGGAAKSCLRLHQGLLREGADSQVLVLQHADHSLAQVVAYQYPFRTLTPAKRLTNKVKGVFKALGVYEEEHIRQRKHLVNRPEGYETFSFAHTPYDLTSQRAYQWADIIHLHWVAGLLDYESFFASNTKPLIWTLLDMNPFTGGCHYSSGCHKFEADCDVCPQLQGTIDPSYSNHILRTKLRSLDKRSLQVVTPSHWLGKLSQASQLFNKFAHQVIPYSLDTDVFQPRDRQFARQLLGLPHDKMLCMFVAESLQNQRKGYGYLLEALGYLAADEDLALCAIGGSGQVGRNRYELGIIRDERLMSLAYSAADVFIIPSLEDNLPNTVLEALACGTPVISFAVGGIQEMIRPSINGLLCEEVSARALAQTITEFRQSVNTFNRVQIREEAQKQYTLEVQARKYLSLYKRLIHSIR